MAPNRYGNALYIQEGAGNLRAIASSLIEACVEMQGSTIAEWHDPAIRLIVHQMASLCNIWEIDNDPDVYAALTRECREKAGEFQPAHR